MNHKFLLISILTLSLGVSLLAGCGGGNGGSEKTPPNSLSSDYFGLQVNYVLTYNCLVYEKDDEPRNISCTSIYKILSEEAGVFKTQNTYSIDPGYAHGEFIEKSTDGCYYFRGEWETDESGWMYPEPPYPIIIRNPVDVGFTSGIPEYGTIVKKETITVPAGTFEAFVFEANLGYGSNTDIYTYHFVPYIGMVHFTNVETEAGETVLSIEKSLTSYYLSDPVDDYVANYVKPGVGVTPNSTTSLSRSSRRKK